MSYRRLTAALGSALFLLIAGCGAGLKKDGRLPVADPLRLEEISDKPDPATQEPQGVRMDANGGASSIRLIGAFSDVEGEIGGPVQQFVISQRLDPARKPQVALPGGNPPATITLSQMTLDGLKFSDQTNPNQAVTFDMDVVGTISLTNPARVAPGIYAYDAVVQSEGADPSLTARLAGIDFGSLVRILTQNGANNVAGAMNLKTDGLPDGSVLTLWFGEGTGTIIF
ncbi:MAG: hypothetical protein IT210_12045 [Armatimonadetes bacterium]|nr:hypothetical protein [Armatimonadota bacterium]